MKKVKFLAMLLMAFSMSFVASSCSDDDDDEEVKSSISEITDTGRQVYFTASYSQGSRNFTQKYIFDYSVGKSIADADKMITGASIETTSNDANVLNQVFSEYNPASNPEVASCRKDGNTIYVVFKESFYDGMTVQSVRETIYPEMKRQMGL